MTPPPATQQAIPECVTLMPRPSERDPRVFDMTARKILPKVQRWMAGHGNGEDPGILQELSATLRHDDDGFARAEYLKRLFSWSPDAELCEILDGAWTRGAYLQLVEEWLKETGIQPRLSIGASVSFMEPPRWHNRAQREGEIVGVDLKGGTYTVFIPALGHVREGVGTHGNVYHWEDIENPPTR